MSICVCVSSTHKVKRNARSAPCFMEDDAHRLQMSPLSARSSLLPCTSQFTDLPQVRAAYYVYALSLHSCK